MYIKEGIIDNLSLQQYLLATDLLKDSIQDSFDMIVTNGKFNNASDRRRLDTKYTSVMKKSNPIDVVFKDKFHTQNPITGMLLTKIQSGKIKTEKAIENLLKEAPSVKDLQIAEQLERLKQYKKRNNNDDNDDDDDDNDTTCDNDNTNDLFLISCCTICHCHPLIAIIIVIMKGKIRFKKFFLWIDLKKLQLRWSKKARLLREKITIKKLFLIIKLILKADEIFDNQRIDGDLPEITMPNTQTIFKELNDGKISEELRFFSRGE